MNTRVLIMVGMMHVLSGCAAQAMAFLSDGENASYSADNWTPNAIQSMKVHAPGNSSQWYDGQAETPPHVLPHGISNYHPTPGGGNQFNSDSGHRIPEEVEALWRRMPAPGGKNYTGEVVGPFRVKVRERIPPEVLRLARKRGMSVGIEFGLTEGRIWVNWSVIDFNGKTATGVVGIVRLCVGGDSYADSTLQALPPPYPGEPPIGVWPHCKLP